MLTAKEVVDHIVSGGDDDHDEGRIFDYGVEIVIDLGGILGYQIFDAKRLKWNHREGVLEIRNFNEALPRDDDYARIDYGSTDADPNA